MKSLNKIGAVILATDQGLGYLAKAFFDHGIIDKVYIHKHTSRTNHYEWYPDEAHVYTEEDLLSSVTTLLFFETPFNWKMIVRARKMGIKTVLIPMYECTQYPFPYIPDLLLCPSALDYEYYGNKHNNVRQVVIPTDIKWQLRKRARVFVHNAGNGGIGGRNGTKELIEAMQYVKSPIKLIVRSQVPMPVYPDPRIDLRVGQFDDIWSEGDVFIFPEKFNGLSLPLQEAFASGMMVMCGSRFPNTEYLPNEPMFEVDRITIEKIAIPFNCAHFDPKVIAACIDKWYDCDIEKFSLLGKDYAEKNSWQKLKEIYKDLLSV